MPEAEIAPAEGEGGQARQGRGNMLGGLFRMFLVYMLVRNLFGGGGSKAPPPGLAFRPRVSRGDPMSMRIFLSEQPEMAVDDLDAVSTAPVWQETDFSLPLTTERTTTISYRPSKVLLSAPDYDLRDIVCCMGCRAVIPSCRCFCAQQS